VKTGGVIGKKNILVNMSRAERNVRIGGLVMMTGSAIGIALTLVFAVAMLLTGCPAPAPPPPNPPPTPATCVRACDHLRRDLLCDTGEGCAELCIRVGDQRFTDCIATAPNCADADRCDTK